MFGRTHQKPADSIEMLRSKGLKRFTEVYTSDGERIGVTLRFVHRPIEDVNEGQRLYRSYLVVQSIVLGGTTYIPTVFINDYDQTIGRVILSENLNTVEEELWNREPNFVARGQGVPEELVE